MLYGNVLKPVLNHLQRSVSTGRFVTHFHTLPTISTKFCMAIEDLVEDVLNATAIKTSFLTVREPFLLVY